MLDFLDFYITLLVYTSREIYSLLNKTRWDIYLFSRTMVDFTNFTQIFWFTDVTKFMNANDANIIDTPENAFSEIPEVMLNILAYADYFLLISVVILALTLGLYKYENKYKSNLYLLAMVAILGYIGIKEFAKSYYENSDEKFLITTLTVLSVLLLGYFFLIQEQQKLQNITFEYPILVLIAFFGLLITIENEEGIIIFLGLEIQAFTFYTMVSLKEKDIFSAEGALKYFLLGAIASGLFIFGLGLLYSDLAQTNFLAIAEIITENGMLNVKLGGLLIIISLLFKIGAAPFHLWVADAYQGSPFFVLLFLITFPKIILYYLIFILNNILEQNLVIFLAIALSAILGSIQANNQTKVKRFIAYTIIFNNCFFLTLTLLTGKTAYYGLLESLLLYLLVVLTTATSFFILVNSETKQHLLSLRDMLAIKKSNVFIGVTLVVGFFSAAGIPPFIGFFQKYLILLALVEKFQIFLVVFLILLSILPAYYYIRMSKIMLFFTETKTLLLRDITRVQATILSILLISSMLIFY